MLWLWPASGDVLGLVAARFDPPAEAQRDPGLG